MATKANIELDAGRKSFATGLLPELIGALRRCGSGDLLAVVSSEETLGADLEAWCRFTRNTLVETTVELDRTRWVIRCGEVPANGDSARPVGSRLWLYTNFDCNLHCDYCCVRSSPKVPRRELGLARIRRPHQFCQEQSNGQQRANDSDEDKDGNVILRHKESSLANQRSKS